jgi:polysaccharide export outer membrane protein
MSQLSNSRFLAPFALVGAVVLSACASTGAYVWAEAAPASEMSSPPPGEYVIQDGDSLAVRVVGQDSASTTGRVRSDGRISVPLIGEVFARGQTTTLLAAEIATRLKLYIVAPAVSVSVQEASSARVSILGEVARPGVYPISPASGLLDAVALAGGLTDYASSDRLFVLRATGTSTLRIRFSYDRLARGEAPDAKFVLRGGDTLVVE